MNTQAKPSEALISAPRLMLYALQSPINIGMILRVAETYKAKVHIFDPHGVFASPRLLETISDFSCGALQRIPPHVFTDPCEITAIRRNSSRLLVTTIDAAGEALPNFAWQSRDIVALGNEYDGLPETLIPHASARLYIPMPDVFMPKPPSLNPIDPERSLPVSHEGEANLNVAISAGILLYSSYLFSNRGGGAKKTNCTGVELPSCSGPNGFWHAQMLPQ